jgi:hypothetical protein
VELGRDRPGFIKRDDAEIERVGLMVDVDVERAPALTAKGSMSEAARFHRPDRRGSLGEGPIVVPDAGKGHRRGAAVELAGPAMAPAAVERVAFQLVPDRAAHAPAG